MSCIKFYCRDCVHYSRDFEGYCDKHTERNGNPYNMEICKDFKCGDERLEVIALYRNALRRIEALSNEISLWDIQHVCRLIDMLCGVVSDTVKETRTDIMSFEEKEAYLTELLEGV